MIFSGTATRMVVWFKSHPRNQRVVTGLKPSFSVDFFVNENYFVSNMVVVLVGSKVAIVKQPKIVKQLINTGKINLQRSDQQR